MSGPARRGNNWVRIDRRYNQPFRLTGHAQWQFLKWGGLIVACVILLSANTWLGLMCMAGVAVYGLIRRQNREPVSISRAADPPQLPARTDTVMRFNPPPGWPISPDWTPPENWHPDPFWPPMPEGWQLWVPTNAPLGQRNSRHIPQAVKIQVAARDQGRCRQCGTTENLHFDRVIPWSKGGTNTVQNIQLLCSLHNLGKSDSWDEPYNPAGL